MSATTTRSTKEWEQARRAAFVQDVLATFTRRPADLLPFEQVRQKLQLHNVHYLGLQDVSLDHIVGSVGRYYDFTRAFLPRQADLQDRWQRIDRLVSNGARLPPIELYKVGQVYFVRDGNHRVSVARHHRFSSIGAHVWECETPVPLAPDTTDIDALLCDAARAAFLEHTQLDHLCPDVVIELTQPDGYEHLLHEIKTFQQAISTIDQREVPLDEAVALWCEMRYTLIVDIIRRRRILEAFPGRTEADLYLWLWRNQEELEARYEQNVLMGEAADDLVKRFSRRFWPARKIKKAVRGMAESIVKGAGGWWKTSR